jgi:hypothetical protein
MDKLKHEALNQIMAQEYHAGLAGDVLCIGLAHNRKRCDVVYKILEKQE